MALGDNATSLQRRLTFTVLFVIAVIGGTFMGLRYAIVRPITCTPNCIGANLLGSDLQGLDLARTNFVEANLQSADLSGANLRQVDLSGSTLAGANLRNADLREAQLIGANLTGADLGGSTLSGANLAGAILDQADLTAVDLTEVVLKGASFNEAKLTNARLTGANLNGIGFAKANLSGALLDDASLSGAHLSSADLSGANLQRVDLTGAWLNLANLTGADLSGGNLAGSRLIGGQLTSANLAGSRLQGAVVIGATLNGANLRSADLRQLRGLASQLLQSDFQIDPILAELNELQRRPLQQDVAMQGVAYDNQTVWEATLRPPDLALDQNDATASAIQSAVAAAATDEEATPTAGAASTARHVKVTFYINSLRNLPDEPGAYLLDFYLDSYWHEPRLVGTTLAAVDKAQLFDPVLEIVNAADFKEWGRRYERSVEPGTNLRLRQRFTAKFLPHFDLRRFPFDEQVLSLQIESAELDNEQLLLDFLGLVEPIVQSEIPYTQSAPRGRYIDVDNVAAEWHVQAVNIAQLIHVLPYDNSAWSQFRIDLVLKRAAAGYIWRSWLMLAFLWLLVGSVLLVDSNALPMRLWLLMVLFGIIAAFQAILTYSLPPFEELTLLDIYLLICYVAIVVMALLVLVIKLLHLRGYQRWARWVNWASIVLYPTVFVVVNVWLLFQAF